jgi:hypothetical protein
MLHHSRDVKLRSREPAQQVFSRLLTFPKRSGESATRESSRVISLRLFAQSFCVREARDSRTDLSRSSSRFSIRILFIQFVCKINNRCRAIDARFFHSSRSRQIALVRILPPKCKLLFVLSQARVLAFATRGISRGSCIDFRIQLGGATVSSLRFFLAAGSESAPSRLL